MMSRTPRAGRALAGGAEGACVRRASEGEPCSEHLPSTHRSFRSSEASERPGRRVAEAALKTISPRFHPGVSLLNSVECTYVTYRPAFRASARLLGATARVESGRIMTRDKVFTTFQQAPNIGNSRAWTI